MDQPDPTTDNAAPTPGLQPIEKPWAEPLAMLCCLAAIGVVLVTRWSWSDIPLQTDTGMWAYIGGRILDGGRLYVDLWESKPPGVFYIFAAIEEVFGRGDTTALSWADGILTLTLLWLTWITARRFASRVASAAAVLLLSLLLTHRVLADWGLNVEKFVALFELAACACAVHYLCRALGTHKNAGTDDAPTTTPPSRTWWLLAGVFCGLAAMFKQTGIAFLLAAGFGLIVVHCANADVRPMLRGAVRRLWLGAILVWAPLILWMWHTGILGGFIDQAVLYDLLRAGSGDLERHRILTGDHWSGIWAHLKIVGVLFGPALIAYLWWLAPFFKTASLDLKPQQRSLDAAMFIVGAYWELTTLIFLIAPYGYGHYLLQAAPPAAIILAWMASRWSTNTRTRSWGIAALAMLLLGVPPLQDQLLFTFDREYPFRRAYDDMQNRMDALCEAVQQHTSADESVLLWPPDAAVSYLAQRRTPLECSNADVIFKGKINRLRPEMPALLARLQKNPPDILIDWTPVTIGYDAGGEPFLGVPAAGFSLLEASNDDHPWQEGRQLAPLKRWVRKNYGDQQYLGSCMLYTRGKPWRTWQEILLPKIP